MATHTGTRKTSPRRQVVAAVGTALAVGAVAGLGSWQIGLHGQSSTRATTATHVQTRVQPQSASQASTVPAAVGSTTSMSIDDHATVALVSSREQADVPRQEAAQVGLLDQITTYRAYL